MELNRWAEGPKHVEMNLKYVPTTCSGRLLRFLGLPSGVRGALKREYAPGFAGCSFGVGSSFGAGSSVGAGSSFGAVSSSGAGSSLASRSLCCFSRSSSKSKTRSSSSAAALPRAIVAKQRGKNKSL